jgi:CBS domain-containing protein
VRTGHHGAMEEPLDMTITAASDIPVSSLAGGAVEWIGPDAPLVEAARRLAHDSIGALVVGDGTEPVGVLSERDVVRAVADERDQSTTTVADVMTRDLRWCDIDATVGDVAGEMMTHYVRHLLLQEAGSLAGIVSIRDLLGALTTMEDVEG